MPSNIDVQDTLNSFLDQENRYADAGDPTAQDEEGQSSEEEEDDDDGDDETDSDSGRKNGHKVSWAARNQDKDVLQARKSTCVEKAVDKARRTTYKMNREKMLEEMEKATQEMDVILTNLGEALHKPPLWCQRMMVQVFGTKQKRRSQIHNACSHFASEKTRNGRES